MEEASKLLSECRFETDDQRNEVAYILSEIPGLPRDHKKPSEFQLIQLKDRSERKKKLLGTASDEVRQTVQKILKLYKEAKHENVTAEK